MTIGGPLTHRSVHGLFGISSRAMTVHPSPPSTLPRQTAQMNSKLDTAVVKQVFGGGVSPM